jgi:hypothetical protein
LKALRLILFYARGYLFFTGIITGAACYLLLRNGTGALSALIWFKMMTSALGAWGQKERSKGGMPFYRNQGLELPALLGLPALLDGGAFVLGLILTLKFSR